MASEYTSFKGIYNGESSGMTTFVGMLCGIVSFGIVMFYLNWIDRLAETFEIGWGWIAFGVWFILTAVFMKHSFFIII
ncbi:hypothetical protein HMPREF2087_00834 [Helicobacter canis NCTC 12740]|uniref:Uncharacterized protein n=1 Tax=Helicobacter canis NCTC 12740 TaxID=1357399 RepID=V8CLL0_9HELI|nr:hypothetical protein HMPREF2087_00834 [Helicobacter canis NCTC 12740]